jgi:hypothetical protein
MNKVANSRENLCNFDRNLPEIVLLSFGIIYSTSTSSLPGYAPAPRTHS